MSAPLIVSAEDRPGALERLLGLVRRKAMKLRLQGITRAGDEGPWSVALFPTAADAPVQRYIHELEGLADVLRVSPSGGSAGPTQPASQADR